MEKKNKLKVDRLRSTTLSDDTDKDAKFDLNLPTNLDNEDQVSKCEIDVNNLDSCTVEVVTTEIVTTIITNSPIDLNDNTKSEVKFSSDLNNEDSSSLNDDNLNETSKINGNNLSFFGFFKCF